MKSIILTLVLITTIGCETKGQRLDDIRADEQVAAAKEQLALGAQAYNLNECYKHLGVNEATADKSPKWRRFAKAHHITSVPVALSDADLKDCEAVK